MDAWQRLAEAGTLSSAQPPNSECVETEALGKLRLWSARRKDRTRLCGL